MLSAALALSGCGVVNNLTKENESKSDEVTGSFKNLVIENTTGEIKVSAADGDKVTVKRTLTKTTTRKPSDSIDKSGDTLKVTGSCTGAGGDCAVDYDIALPKGISIQAKTTVGGIAVSGVQSKSVTANTTLGDVAVGVTGDVDKIVAHSDGGAVTVTVPGGKSYSVKADAKLGLGKANVTVPTGSGPSIQASSNRGDVNVKSA